jgi:hypothetical protein
MQVVWTLLNPQQPTHVKKDELLAEVDTPARATASSKSSVSNR